MADRDLFITTAAQALGVPVSIIDAHLRTETGDGSKTVGAFNYGNIKAGSRWAGPTAALNALEYDKAGNPIKEPSRFRAYADAKSAGEDYANLLLRKYPGTVGAQSAEVFAAALKAGGYATDPKYVQKFLGVAGGSIPAAAHAATPAARVSIAPPPVLNPDPLKEEMPDKTWRAGGTGFTIPPLTDINLPPDVDLAAAAKVAGDAAQAKVASTDYSLLEQARRASDSSGLMGAITRTIADMTRDSTVDPLYKTDPKKLVGLTESEQEHVLGSTSLQDEEYRLWQIKDRKESAEIVAAKGAGRAFLAGTLSELPVGFGAGIATSRAFAAMRSAGLVGGGYGTLAAAGFAASSVVEVLQAQIDPWWSKDDAIANVVLGTALEVGLGSAFLAREGKLRRNLEAAQTLAMDRRFAAQLEAQAKVGADPETAAKEVDGILARDAAPPEPPAPVLPEQAAPAARWDEDDLPGPDAVRQVPGTPGTFRVDTSPDQYPTPILRQWRAQEFTGEPANDVPPVPVPGEVGRFAGDSVNRSEFFTQVDGSPFTRLPAPAAGKDQLTLDAEGFPVKAPEPEPVKAPEPEPVKAPEPEPVKAPEPEPVKAPEPEPVKAPEPEPVKAPEPEPVKAPEPEPVKAPEPEDTRLMGTRAQIANAAAHAEAVGGRVIAVRGNIALIEGYNRLNGAPVYIGTKGQVRTNVDISLWKGKGALTKDDLLELRALREHELAEVRDYERKYPDGPFKDSHLVFGEDIPDRFRGVVSGWAKLLGLDSARIVVTTPASGVKMAQEYKGKFRRVGRVGVLSGFHGLMQPLGGGDYQVALNLQSSKTATLEALAHELGHIVEKRAFADAPASTKAAIMKDYEKFLEGLNTRTAKEHLEMLRAFKTAGNTPAPDGLMAKDLTAYWKSFGEWFADQTARWATTQAKPLGVVEQFFNKLADVLSRFFVGERAKFTPSTSVTDFLNSLSPVGPVSPPSTQSLSRQQRGLIARAMQTLRSLFRSTPGGDGMGRPDLSWQGWDSATVWEHRARDFGPSGKNAGTIARMTFGQYKTLADLDALPAGIHLQAGRDFSAHMKSLETLRKKFLGVDMRIVLADADPELKTLNANGAAIMLKEDLVIINLDLSKPVKEQVPVLIHEVGHAVWQKYASKLTPKMRAGIDRAYQDFLHESGRTQARMRYANYNKNATVTVGNTKYELSRDEFSAEQFVKFIEDDVLRGSNSLRLERSFAESLVAAVMKMLAFFKEGLAGFRRADVAYGNLFESILDKQSAMQQAAKQSRAASAPSGRSLSVSTVPDAGLNLAPNATAQQGAEAKFIAQLYEEARSPDFEVDERRLSTLYNTALFQGAQSNTNTLLRSENPVARMFAAKFMESPSGAAGRRANPAIAKTLHERAMLGNAVNEMQAAYRDYRQAIGGSVTEDTFGGKHWDAFNRAVAQEIEARSNGSPVQSPASVKQAADALEKAYERALKLQVSTKTTGWANLPANSRGYMPHRLSKDKLLTAKPQEFGALHDALTEQFIRLGMDMSFADQFAAKYVTRAKERALGGFDTPTGAQHVGAAEVVEEALEAMGMSRDEVLATMKRFMRAGPGHTKARLELDLNKEVLLEDGSTFRLGDFYEYDQLNLLRSQVSRVSGEVALTEFGIPGKAGLDLYRRAFMYGEGRVTQEELGAFDQFAAEMMGMPYGTQSKVVDRLIQANSLARLGGMGFTQAAEAINGMWHLGVGRMMDTIVGIPRLRDEIKALVRGEAVDNPIIGSVGRAYGGAEFGTDSYKTVFPFDNKALEVQAYGQETITLLDRLLRGGGHLQGKLSMWRTLHATQQRGMAEGIVRKAAVYLKDGGEADVWLRDMGLSDTLIQRLRADLDKIAEFDSAGRLAKLDITKTDAEVAREFAQVVWRGVNQIIQGTFPGERNRWATDAHMRLLTQFRTFSLTAVEKQWGRMVGNVGAYKAAGIMIGSMCAVLPIYAARVYASALGREDADAYIDRAFEPERIARQALNYTASSGLVGDLLDVLGATSGVSLGGRTGTQEEAFFGSLVAPSAALLNDLYGAVQNTEEGTSFEELAKSAPFSKLPYVIPMVNVLFAD